MVGGRIVETVSVSDEKLWVNCVDLLRPKEECAIYLDPQGNTLRVGDSLWWQGSFAMWTPSHVRESGVGESDIKLPRIGFSGVHRPL